jgi:cell wall-associated NlpC family hydrolase
VTLGRAIAGAAVTAALVLTCGLAPALAEPLAAAAARRERADQALGQAAEDYDQAREELAQRRRSAVLADAAARSAGARLDEARAQLGRLAAQAYRSGAQSTGLAVVLAPAGPQDVLDRAALVRTLGERRHRLLERLDTTRTVVNLMDHRAGVALAAQQVAAQRVRATRDRAERQATAARAVVRTVAAEQRKLTAQLAAARHTSVSLERRRQRGLDAARRRREARAAREAHSRAERRPDEDPGNSSGSGFGNSSGSGTAGRSALAWGIGRLGLPYRWGGAGPDSYDCSGLTMRAWQRSGVLLPHSSRMQYAQVSKVRYSELRPGDLIFWASEPSSPGTIHHVALYAGGGMILEAPATGLDVRRVPIRWPGTMPFAGRP